jgi:putative cell wall-binding protein
MTRTSVTGGPRVVLVAVALVTALLASPAGAAPTCFADRASDTVRVADGNRVAANLAAADLAEHCAELGRDAVTLTARTYEPTDPRTDPSWASPRTALTWTLETDRASYTVRYGRNGDGVAAVVTDADGQRACDAAAGVVDGRYVVEVDPACVGSPARLVVSLVFTYDADPGDEAVYVDDTVARGRERLRVSGPSRLGTSAAIAQFGFPQGAKSVYLARADFFADAVAAGALMDGPILLVPPCPDTVPGYVREQIARLDPMAVVALGGQQAVCEALLQAAAEGRDAVRVAGPSRIETAVAIAQRAFPAGAEEVYLAEASVFADAVAGGVLTRGPVLLVPGDGPIPAVVGAEIDRLASQRVVALGGPAAVSDAVLAEAGGDRPTARIAGPTRIDTAVAIAAYASGERATEVYLARFDAFADAVVAGTLTRGPILLVPTEPPLPEAVAATVARLNPLRVVALGGTAAVSEDVLVGAARAGS